MDVKMLSSADPWSALFQRGTVLWRACRFYGDGPTVEPAPVEFEQTTRSRSFIGRIILCGATGMWEPEVMSNRIDATRFTRGIAVFVQDVPPPNWTHLIVRGVSKRFEEPGSGAGGCVFAAVAPPLPLAEYCDFRRRLFNARVGNLNVQHERVVEITRGIWPTSLGPDVLRLTVQQAWEPGIEFQFAHVVRENPGRGGGEGCASDPQP